jgi:hypothetical protein
MPVFNLFLITFFFHLTAAHNPKFQKDQLVDRGHKPPEAEAETVDEICSEIL